MPALKPLVLSLHGSRSSLVDVRRDVIEVDVVDMDTVEVSNVTNSELNLSRGDDDEVIRFVGSFWTFLPIIDDLL